jgi:hypothetical protein
MGHILVVYYVGTSSIFKDAGEDSDSDSLCTLDVLVRSLLYIGLGNISLPAAIGRNSV